jgi:xylulokinase
VTTGAAARDAVALTVDLGSGGLKVGYTSLAGTVLWWHHEWIPTTYDGPAVTQDAHGWWDAVVRAARRGLAESGVAGERVVGVAITGQWSSVVPVDADGIPVSDVVMWNDERGAPHSADLIGGPVVGYDPRQVAAWLRRTAGVPNPTGQDALSHRLHLDRDRPEVSSRARWYLEPVDYLSIRFTGRAVASPMSMIASWLTDNRDLARVDYDPGLVRRAGIDASKLPPLVPSGSIVGTVRPDVAELLGIPASARVVTGAPDLHSAVVGSGCVRPFEAHISIGTTSWVSCPVPFKRTSVINQIASLPGIGDGQYLVANNQDNAGRCLEWFRDVWTGWGGQSASFEEILARAGGAEPGCGGVIFTPWLTGERSTLDDRNARGGFHNVSLSTGPDELARAVLEGVAMNLRMLLEATDRFVGRRLDPLRMIGGAARSDLWCQIVADVTDRRIERVADPFLSGLRGAALLLALGLGVVQPGEVRGLVPVDATFRPATAARGTYDRLYKEFPRLHSRNKGMFARLNA